MGSTKYTQDELKRMRVIMLQDPVFGSPEYASDLSQTKQYEAVKLPHVDSLIQKEEFKNFEVEASFTGSISFSQSEQKTETISLVKEESVTIVEEKIESKTEQPSEDIDKKAQQAVISKFIATPKIPDIGDKLLKTTEAVGKAAESLFDATFDLFNMIIGKDSKQPKEKDPKKAQEKILMNRQNAQVVEQAVKEAKVISESRAQKDFQRIAGDEAAFIGDEAKKKILNLQEGLERKFTAKDAADLRNSLIEQKKKHEQQKAATEIRSATGPSLDKNLANEQSVHSIYNTAG